MSSHGASILGVMEGEEWSADQLASLLRVHPSTLRLEMLSLFKRGLVVRRRVGNGFLYRRADVDPGDHVHRCGCGARWDEAVSAAG